MATGRVNVGGSGGGANIYAQMTEPPKKEGIWFKTSENFRKIIDENIVWLANKWNEENKLKFASAPVSTAYWGMPLIIGNEMWIFCNSGLSSGTLLKYNFDTDVWTKVADGMGVLPRYFAATAGVIHYNGYIYIVGTYNGEYTGTTYLRGIYKYSIAENKMTLIKSASRTMNMQQWFEYNGKLYGRLAYDQDYSGEYWKTFMFDPVTENLVESNNGLLANIKLQGNKYVGLSRDGGYVYFIDYAWNLCRANIETEVSEILIKLPTSYQNPATNGMALFNMFALNGYVYLLRQYNTTYDTDPSLEYIRFNTMTGMFESMDRLKDIEITSTKNNIPFTSWVYKNDIFTMRNSPNGVTANAKLNRFAFTSKKYPQNTALLFRTDARVGSFYTELLPRDLILKGSLNRRFPLGFDDAWLFANGDIIKTIPTYYGNGSAWVKLKN